jgi:hypothetical protein
MCSAVIPPRALGLVALLAGLGLALSAEAPGHERTVRGEAEKMGAGTVQSFVTLDPSNAPIAIGVTLSAGALEQLPAVPNTVSRCFDLDGNGRHTGHECMGDDERILDVPVDSTAGLPFRWIAVNWNPAGHYNTPYARPHFDFHFHTGDRATVEAIYGAWDGKLIFWEPMITLDLLQKTQDACMEIRQPKAFRQAGYYPTQYCVRQDGQGQRTVSLGRFRYSEAL